jgi:hypothetical protein
MTASAPTFQRITGRPNIARHSFLTPFSLGSAQNEKHYKLIMLSLSCAAFIRIHVFDERLGATIFLQKAAGRV